MFVLHCRHTISSKILANRPAMGNYPSSRNSGPANAGPRNNNELPPVTPNVVRPGKATIAQAQMDNITDRVEALNAFKSDAYDYLKHATKNLPNSSSNACIDNSYCSHEPGYGAPLNNDTRPHSASANQHEYQNGFRTNNVQKREFARSDSSSSYGRDASADNDTGSRNSSQKRDGYSDSRRSQPGESTFSKSREHTSFGSHKPSLEDKIEASWEDEHDHRGRDHNQKNDRPRDGKPSSYKDRQDGGRNDNNKSSFDENHSKDDNRRNDRLRDGKPPYKGRQENSRDDDNNVRNDRRSRDETRNRNDNRKNEDGYGRNDHHRRDHDRNSDDNRKMSRIRGGDSSSQKSSSRDGFDEGPSSRIPERDVASAQHGRVEVNEVQPQPDNQIGFSQPPAKNTEQRNASDRTSRTGRTSDISDEPKKSPLSKARDGPKNESSKVSGCSLFFIR